MSIPTPPLPLPLTATHLSLNPNDSNLFQIPTQDSIHEKTLCLKVSSTSSGGRKPTHSSPAGDFFRQLAVSSVLFLGLGLNRRAFAASPSSLLPPIAVSADHHTIKDTANAGESDIRENKEIEEMQEAFEKWKSKTYALTVPLRIVALRNSFPPAWFQNFMASQGKRVKLHTEFRQSLQELFSGLRIPHNRGTFNPKSALAADIISIGDSWLTFAVKEGLIEPIPGAEDEDWFQNLTKKWKEYLRRSGNGDLDSHGQIWGAPYRWGSMVIAYKKSKFQKHKLAPIEDWDDLWRPELAGKISMVNSPREIVGATLKYMGASYNAHNIDSHIAGGKIALQEKLALLAKQVRLFDSQYYLKAFMVGDVWVAVGWSCDVLPAAKRMSNVAVIVPKSGASLWADFWAIPAASRLETDKIGGRVRGPSPLVNQWIEFCLQPERALSFKEEAIAGTSPVALEEPVQETEDLNEGQPKLDTNLIASLPPSEILARCEFLEPLPEDTLSDYQWLIDSIKKPNHSMVQTFWHYLRSMIQLLPKVRS